MAKKQRSNELTLTRIFDAPVKTVWEAWTDPDQVAQWWGPRGFTLTTHSKDLRAGGSWVYTMHGPDGTDYPNDTKYLEVDDYSRLVYDHGANDDRPPLFRVTVLFIKVAKDKTKMEMTMSFASPDAAAEAAKFIKKAGGHSTWDRLAEYLEKETKNKDVFVINRSFDAPVDRVFEMWSKPEHSSRWLPPTGFGMRFIRAEIKPGASSFFSMTNGKDITMHARTEYLAIEPPHRIVYTQQFCDENETVSHHPLMPVWPKTMLITVWFAQEDLEKTRITVMCEVHGDATSEQTEAFNNTKGSMTQGWSNSFDQLEALL